MNKLLKIGICIMLAVIFKVLIRTWQKEQALETFQYMLIGFSGLLILLWYMHDRDNK